MYIGMRKNQLAELVDYTPRQLYNLDTKLPEDKKLFVQGEDGKFDLALFIQRWVDFNVEREKGDDLDYDQVKTEHERAKKRKTELQVQQMEGELIHVRDVRRLWGNVVDSARKALLQLPNQVAPRLMMMDNSERISGILDAEIRRALEQIADTPLPAYVHDGGEGE